MSRILRLILVAAFLLPIAARAQDNVPRPKLAAGADTNDSQAYMQAGNALLPRDPGKAMNAFYWATRLDPWSAEAYYGRRISMLLSQRHRLVRYWTGDRRTIESKEVREADSLMKVALEINPFFYRHLDGVLFDEVLRLIAEDYAQQTGQAAGEIQYALDLYMRNAPPALRAYHAYTQRAFPDALKLYAEALRTASKDRQAALLLDRAGLFAQLAQNDSATDEYQLALQAMREKDKKSVVYFYQSKALIEHSVGLLFERDGFYPAAKAAYGRALQEDLSYAPAHVQMAMVAYAQKDTATAVNELSLAVDISPENPRVHHLYGVALVQMGKHKDAEEHLRKAITLEPYFAATHYALGQALEGQQRAADAAAEYRTFVAMAPKRDPRLADASQRLGRMGGGE